MFKDKFMRRQLSEILVYHQAEINEAQNEMRFIKRIIIKIDTPIFTPDGEKA